MRGRMSGEGRTFLARAGRSGIRATLSPERVGGEGPESTLCCRSRANRGSTAVDPFRTFGLLLKSRLLQGAYAISGITLCATSPPSQNHDFGILVSANRPRFRISFFGRVWAFPAVGMHTRAAPPPPVTTEKACGEQNQAGGFGNKSGRRLKF